MSALWLAYRVLAPCLGAVAPAGRMFVPHDEQALWNERLGRLGPRMPVDAWIHAASLGESLAVPPLVRSLAGAAPGARFHLSATTLSGRARLAESASTVSLAPLDAPQAIEPFLAAVRPRRVFVVETELWPHWLLALSRANVPVAFVSARLSDRSVRRYRRLGSGFATLVRGLGAVLCQTAADRERWLRIGAPPERTAVVGNLKSDALPMPASSRESARQALGLDPERPLLVLASIRPGEPGLAARAWGQLAAATRERWQVAALPRHPRASAELRAEAMRSGASLADGGAPMGGAWRWDDRLGVLAEYYAAADVALIGGSLVPLGGHNPLEAAACGAAVIIGPYHESQAEGVGRLRAHRAVRVAGSAAELCAVWEELLGSPGARAEMSAGGLATVAELRGAGARTVARLAEWKLWPPA